MRPAADRRSRAIVALGALAIIWGYNWVVMKVAVHDAPPFQFAAMRTCGGALALCGTALILRKPLRLQFPLQLFWIGFFQTAGFVGLATWAVTGAGAGHAAVLAYTMPLWVSLLAWPVLGERIGVWQGLAMVIAFAGIACMVGPLRAVNPATCIAVGAGLSWAIGVVLTKRLQLRAPIDTFSLTTWQMVFGGVVLLIAAVLVPAHPVTWSGSYIFAVAYNIVLATALAYTLWTFVLSALPARDAGMGGLAVPVIGVLASWLQLGEVPTPLSALGMILIVAGLALLTFADRRTA